MISHKNHQVDRRGTRSKVAISRAMKNLRSGGKCSATRNPRFPDFGAVVAAALLASPEMGRVQLTYCLDCSGFHISRFKGDR